MSDERDNAQRALIAGMWQISRIIEELGRLRSKPLYGGIFGSGQFSLCSAHAICSGLDHVFFMVREVRSGAVIAGGDTKIAALRAARECLSVADSVRLSAFFGQYLQDREDAAAALRKRMREEEAERFAAATVRRAKVKSISRRRKRIFDEADGKCHYCSTALTLDGKWHIEHKFPRALGGGDEPGNLVASCAPCNHEKRDTTDIEFKAKRAAIASLKESA